MDVRYPIGKFDVNGEITGEQRARWMEDIEALPHHLQEAVSGLTEDQLNTPYRDGGWTVRQVVHHYADSHMNSFMRFKLALTEENPAIKPYAEADWAELADSRQAPIEWSLSLVKALHARWMILLRSLSSDDFQKTFYHPESKKVYSLDLTLGIYAWHSKHHVAQIKALRERMGW